MTVNWVDTTNLSFNNLLLLERVQISWLEGLAAENLPLMAAALKANPVVSWYLQHKCPSITPWLDNVNSIDIHENDPENIRKAECQIMEAINDWLVYVVDPCVYDAQPFLKWDDQELTSLIDFKDKIVLDIGSGTGRLAFLAAPNAYAVYPVEPVANLRFYIKEKAKNSGFDNIYPVDGLITDIPFHDSFADITMGGHVFGDKPQHELLEMERVTKSGGVVILCPGNNDVDNQSHHLLIDHGFSWLRFEEPQDGWKRKYWKTI